MLEVITCGKKVAEYSDYLAAHRHARNLSNENREVSVYVQDGKRRSCYRNGYNLY